jgi:hypothetical protein
LLGRTQPGEAPDIWRCIEELGKAALEVVVGGHVVEHYVVGHQGLREQIASPTKWPGAGELEVGPLELNSTLFYGQHGFVCFRSSLGVERRRVDVLLVARG